MKVDKCQTEHDIAKFYFKVNTVVGMIVIIINLLYGLEFNSIFLKDIKKTMLYDAIWLIVPFVVIEIILFIMWFPYENGRKKAFKYGEKYDADIVKIYTKDKGKLRITPRELHYFDLRLAYVKAGKKVEFLSEIYLGTHFHYIPKNCKCKIYEYKGKAYVQDFPYISNDELEKQRRDSDKRTEISPKFYRGRNYTKLENLFKFSNEDIPLLNDEDFKLALAEREVIPPKSSNKHILMPGIMISDGEKQAYVFVELQINSIRAYDFEDFKFYKELNKFLRINAKEYFSGNVEEYTGIVKEFVTEKSCEVLNKDENFILNNVLVAIRNV